MDLAPTFDYYVCIYCRTDTVWFVTCCIDMMFKSLTSHQPIHSSTEKDKLGEHGQHALA